MNKYLISSRFLISLALVAISSGLFSQNLPDLEVNITSDNYFEICAQLDAHFALEMPESDCPDNAFVKYQRWKWFWRDRVNIDGSFPDLREQWLESRKRVAENLQNRSQQPEWQNEGPRYNPNGGYWGMGRTKHVAFHPFDPNIMWVGTPDGGIWKTTDGGNNWNPMGDGLPYLPVSVILVDYQNPETLYISLGDKGGWWMWNLGIYKSTDGGNTWAPTGLDWKLTQNNVIYNMVMSPSDPQTILVASNRGVLRTKDGGVTWETLRTGEYTDIVFHPSNDSTIYAAHHNYWGTSQVDKTTNTGDSWEQISDFQTSENTIRLAVSPLMPEWLGVHFSNGKLFLLSKDGGLTYTENQAPDDDWGIFAFSPTDTNTVYICGVVVSRSQDQGANWEPITHWYNDNVHAEVHADAHDLIRSPHNQAEIWYCNDGGIYRYNESTETWKDFSSSLAIAQFYRIDVSQVGELKIAAGSQDNGGWLRTSFGGWSHTNGGDAMCQIIDPEANNIMYTEYYGGNDIYRTTDSYINSTNIADNIPGQPSGDWVTPFILNPQNGKTFIAGFEDVFRSFDRGNHFHKISDNLTGDVNNELRDIVMSPTDTNVIYACWSKRVYRTSDGGQSWNQYFIPATEDITRLFVHPTNPQKVWVTTGGYSAGKKVFCSSTAGTSWQNLSGNLPNVPVNCILFDSITNYLMIGTDIGVYYSDADVINWKPYGQGMPAVYVLDLKIRHSIRRLYAGTHGRGVFSIPLETLVGTQEELSSDVKKAVLYPNPANTQVYFKSTSTVAFDGSIRLFDAMGKLRLTKPVRNQRLDDQILDIASLPAGLYYVQIVGVSGKILTSEKLVKL
ncbi:MAG: T9SS type A sorting domain-containing protein [Lewinellaceae bacterium]|nr:T9SS type A sorting domain-containing protein [Saprospiraceae bacterium]MCB9344787.1 T9SS type A sorting domain-containing protein [Lewinellaceae bacterium]